MGHNGHDPQNDLLAFGAFIQIQKEDRWHSGTKELKGIQPARVTKLLQQLNSLLALYWISEHVQLKI